jgi:hypothetical protein
VAEIEYFDAYGYLVLNDDEVNVGDTVEANLVVVQVSSGPIFNLELRRDGELIDIETPEGGIPPDDGNGYRPTIQFTLKTPEFESEYDLNVPLTFSFTDSDGVAHSYPGKINVKIDNRPTNCALYFDFRDSSYEYYSPAEYEVRITPPFATESVLVSEAVTITKSGNTDVELVSISDGLAPTPGYIITLTIPYSVAGEKTATFLITKSGGSGDADDLMDLALTYQKAGQPWIWP